MIIFLEVDIEGQLLEALSWDNSWCPPALFFNI